MANMICACCGTDITAPKFKDGKAYGWACYSKLFSDKGKKPNRMIAVDFISLENCGFVVDADSIETVKGGMLSIRLNGRRYIVPVLLNQERANAYKQGEIWFCSLATLQKSYPNVSFE